MPLRKDIPFYQSVEKYLKRKKTKPLIKKINKNEKEIKYYEDSQF